MPLSSQLQQAQGSLALARLKEEMEFLQLVRQGRQFDPRFQGGVGGTDAAQRALEVHRRRRAGGPIQRGGGLQQVRGVQLRQEDAPQDSGRAEQLQRLGAQSALRNQRLDQREALRVGQSETAKDRDAKVLAALLKGKGKSTSTTGKQLSSARGLKLIGDTKALQPSRRFATAEQSARTRERGSDQRRLELDPEQQLANFQESEAFQRSGLSIEQFQELQGKTGLNPFEIASVSATGQEGQVRGVLKALNQVNNKFELSQGLFSVGAFGGNPDAERIRQLEGVLRSNPRISQHPDIQAEFQFLATQGQTSPVAQGLVPNGADFGVNADFPELTPEQKILRERQRKLDLITGDF